MKKYQQILDKKTKTLKTLKRGLDNKENPNVEFSIIDMYYLLLADKDFSKKKDINKEQLKLLNEILVHLIEKNEISVSKNDLVGLITLISDYRLNKDLSTYIYGLLLLNEEIAEHDYRISYLRNDQVKKNTIESKICELKSLYCNFQIQFLSDMNQVITIKEENSRVM